MPISAKPDIHNVVEHDQRNDNANRQLDKAG